MKLQKENTYSMLLNISLSNIFLDLSLQTRKTEAKISKSDYIKVKASAQQNLTINNRERQPTKWQNIFANHIFDRD